MTDPKPAAAFRRATPPPANKPATRAPVSLSPTKTPADATKPVATTTRLNKQMAELQMASRREADDWINRGWVKVNGEVASMGMRVSADARIEVNKQAQGMQANQVTILVNKPMGLVSGQAEDGHLPAITLVQPQNRWVDDNARFFFHPKQLQSLVPAGRLDIDSIGLLVLTQDGRVARQLIGEDSVMEKEYLVRVAFVGLNQVDQTPGQLIRIDDDDPITTNVQAIFPHALLAKLRHGLSLDGQALKPAQVAWQNPEQLRVVLTEGKKRQIRRMCELVGLKVVGLKRVRIGNVMLGNLPLGQWRYLAPHEKF